MRPAARRDLGTSDESVLRKQSRHTVASGAEAWTVAPGRATNLAGCARPARSARRATRGRDRGAPSALERASRPKRHRRRVLGAVVSELRSSQLGPKPRVIPTCPISSGGSAGSGFSARGAVSCGPARRRSWRSPQAPPDQCDVAEERRDGVYGARELQETPGGPCGRLMSSSGNRLPVGWMRKHSPVPANPFPRSAASR